MLNKQVLFGFILASCFWILYCCNHALHLSTEENSQWCVPQIAPASKPYSTFANTLPQNWQKTSKKIPFQGKPYAIHSHTPAYPSEGSVLSMPASPRMQSYGGGISVSPNTSVVAHSSYSRNTNTAISVVAMNNLALPMMGNGNKNSMHNPTQTIAPTPRAARAAAPKVSKAPQKPQHPQAQQPVSSISAISMNSLALGYASASQYINPTMYRAPGNGAGSTFDNWLTIGTGSSALSYTGDNDTYYYDMAELKRLFEEAQANGDMPGMTWEQFLEWFNHADQKSHFAPIGDAWILLLLLAVGYAIIIRKRKTLMQKKG